MCTSVDSVKNTEHAHLLYLSIEVYKRTNINFWDNIVHVYYEYSRLHGLSVHLCCLIADTLGSY